MKLSGVLCLLCLCLSHTFAGQAPPTDPVVENLFPPELVMQHQSEIKLTEDQRDALMAEIQKAQSRLADLQGRLQKEVDALGVLLKKDAVDEQGALAQLDKVLNEEREIKRAHLALVLGIKNKLTTEQEVKLREIKTKIAAGQLPSAEAVQRVLERKLKNVHEGVQGWQNEGRDPSKVAEIMQEFEPLMKAARLKDAEALLDRVLKLLREPDKDKKRPAHERFPPRKQLYDQIRGRGRFTGVEGAGSPRLCERRIVESVVARIPPLSVAGVQVAASMADTAPDNGAEQPRCRTRLSF